MTLDQFDALNERFASIHKAEMYTARPQSGIGSNYNVGFVRGMAYALTFLGYEVTTDLISGLPQVNPTGVKKGNVE